MRRWRPAATSVDIFTLTYLPTWPSWRIVDVAELLRHLTADERDELWCRWIIAGYAEWARPFPVTRQLAVYTSPGYERAGVDIREYHYSFNPARVDLANPLWTIVATKLFAGEMYTNRKMFQKIVTLAMTVHERCILIDMIAASGVAVHDWAVDYMQQYRYYPCGRNDGLIMIGRNINHYNIATDQYRPFTTTLTEEWCHRWNQMVLSSGASTATSVVVKDLTPGKYTQHDLTRQQRRYVERRCRKMRELCFA